MGSMITDGKKIYKVGVTTFTTIRYTSDDGYNSGITNSLHYI